MFTKYIAPALLMFSVAGSAAADSWAIDPSHSDVGFSVRHLMISKTKGEFKKVSGTAEIDDKNPTQSRMRLEIDVNSIDTDDQKRDQHLTSPDFFDAQKYPKIIFESKKITKAGKGYKVSGDLTMHGVTKPITLDATLTKPVASPFGTANRGVEVSGTINRKDFGMTWNKSLDGGGLVVGEEVNIDVVLELIKR